MNNLFEYYIANLFWYDKMLPKDMFFLSASILAVMILKQR